MRLLRIQIARYKNFVDFKIDLDRTQSATVLLGRNGTGKSYLFEAIVEIFRELELGRPTKFGYCIDYENNDYIVQVECTPSITEGCLRLKKWGTGSDGARVGPGVEVLTVSRNAGGGLTHKGAGSELRQPLRDDGFDDDVDYQLSFEEWQRELRAMIDPHLPTNVFAYYSGWSSRLERQFAEPTRAFCRELRDDESSEIPLRRLIFFRREYSQLILLSLLLDDRQQTRALLRERLGIECLESALFVLHRPRRGEPRGSESHPEKRNDGRFWGERGGSRQFLDLLWDAALAPLRATSPVERDVRYDDMHEDRVYLFLKDAGDLAKLRSNERGPRRVFNELESLFLCDILVELQIEVLRTDGSRVNLTQMSEGEQQLLTILGMLRLTDGQQSLFLLDEPDTHLNAAWSHSFLPTMREAITEESAHLLIASHDPLMVGALRREQVRVLETHGTRTVARVPDIDPIGLGIEGLLKSELYGLPSTLAPEIVDKLEEHYRLLGTKHRTTMQAERFRELAEELGKMRLCHSDPDPYFELFATRMARVMPVGVGSRSADQIAMLDAAADRILAEVLGDGA